MNGVFEHWLPWVQTFGWTLVHSVWQGFLIGAVYAAVRALLPRTGSGARYTVGLIALAAMVAWPVMTFLSLRPLPAAPSDAGSAVAIGVAAMDAAGTSLLARIEAFTPWLVAAWAIGVLVVLLRSLLHWRMLTRIAKDADAPDSRLDAALSELKCRFGLVQSVCVRISSRIDTPTLIGWIKPVVLLPAAVMLRFPREHVELILAHELGHLRRYDHLVNLVQAVIETLLFHHPVVHWISRDVRNERELCCDELVLRLTQGEAREYARTLAALEELRHVPSSLALAASGGELVERVRRIVGLPPHARQVSHGPRTLLALAAIGVSVLLAVRAVREDATLFTSRLPQMDWTASARLPMPSLSAFALTFDLPQLRIARIEAPQERVVPDHPVGDVAKTDPAAVAPPAEQASARSVTTSVATAERAPQRRVSANAAEPAEAPNESPASPASAERVPVAIHVVQPKFPRGVFSGGSVVASFALTADGAVTDIAFEQVEANGPFVRAVERALRQWRFDPATIAAGGKRYTQAFVFKSGGPMPGDRECYRQTGSQICRDLDDTSWASSYSPHR